MSGVAFQYTTVRGEALKKKDVAAVVSVLESTGKKRLDSRETATALVDASRPKASPTHHLFNWDDTRAAELYRLDQAHKIIASIRVIFEDAPDEPLRAFPVVVTRGKQGYYPMPKVLSDEHLTRALLDQAKADLVAWSNRYARLKHVAELGGAFVAADVARVRKAKPAPKSATADAAE